MVRCISRFMDACYIVRRNAIAAPALELFLERVAQFHELRDIFIITGVRETISLPRQHSLCHYATTIQLFGSPNGLCSSITESKHIKAVKEPWRRSSRYKALPQILQTLLRLEKIAALRRHFAEQGMLTGSTASFMAGITDGVDPQDDPAPLWSENTFPGADEDEMPLDSVHDAEALSLVTLSARPGASVNNYNYICSHYRQKLAIRITCEALPPLSNSPTTFPLHFGSFCSSLTIPIAPAPPIHSLSCRSFMAVYRFTTRRSQRSSRRAISVVSEGCVKNGFAQRHLGTTIPATTRYTSSWMTPFPAWKVWSLCVSVYSYHLIIRGLTTLAHSLTGLSVTATTLIQILVCGLSLWRSRAGSPRPKSLM